MTRLLDLFGCLCFALFGLAYLATEHPGGAVLLAVLAMWLAGVLM